jgi:hypothetical protein
MVQERQGQVAICTLALVLETVKRRQQILQKKERMLSTLLNNNVVRETWQASRVDGLRCP